MDAKRLLIFREVVRSGSISAAARRLGWTQPAVSQHLRAFETEVGCALLVRGTRGVTVTEPGRVLLDRADAVSANLRMADAELEELKSLGRGRVRVAAYPSGAATRLPRALARVQNAHPGLDVELTEAEPPEVTAMLAEDRIDLALIFSYSPTPEPAAGLEWTSLGTEPIVLVVPHGHPAASSTRSPWAELDVAQAWIVGCDRCRAHTMATCARVGVNPVVRHVTDDYVIVQNLVAEGLGVSLLPQSALTAYRHPAVEVIEDPTLGIRHLGLSYRSGAQNVFANAAVIASLAATGPVRPSPAPSSLH